MSEELTDRESPRGRPWKRRLTLDDVRASYVAEREKKRARRAKSKINIPAVLLFTLAFVLLSIVPVFCAFWRTSDWSLDSGEAAKPFALFCLFMGVVVFPCVLAGKRQSFAWLAIALFMFLILWLPFVLLEWFFFLFLRDLGPGL